MTYRPNVWHAVAAFLAAAAWATGLLDLIVLGNYVPAARMVLGLEEDSAVIRVLLALHYLVPIIP